MSTLTDRFDTIYHRLTNAVRRSGRRPEDVRLIAVSKTHPAGVVAELAVHWAAIGRPVFGESYMQEARDKMPEVEGLLAARASRLEPEWHFVGRVQSKKARDVAGRFALIHSVDSLKLAQALQKAWLARVASEPVGLDDPPPPPQAVLVQVNVGREPQKAGVMPEELESLLNSLHDIPELAVLGLMCLPPLQEIGENSRPWFSMLRDLRERMETACGLRLAHLSMGMSDDFEAAIEEGATLVRIGTDIFGPRA